MGCSASEDTTPELDFNGAIGDPDEIRERFIAAGQGHVFNAWDDMDEDEKSALIRECTQFDVHNINQLFSNLVLFPQTAVDEDFTHDFDTVEPELISSKMDLSPIDKTTYSATGLDLIRQGQVAVVMLAGGQGSRLGYEGPKGKFDIGLPSQKTLFQILTERFYKAQMIAHDMTVDNVESADGINLPVVCPSVLNCKMFIMTNHENHAETVKFFADNAYFGGQESSFVFFPQQMLPALDKDGKILMKKHCNIKLAPNGNGAMFESIKSNESVRRALSDFQYVQIIGVDNALNKVLDPIQIGMTHHQQLQTSLKSCAKRHANEKVGVIGKKNGKYNIVEYSEIPEEIVSQRKSDGTLKFNEGHILILVIRTDFLIKLCTGSQSQTNALYHKAHKKIDHVDPETFADIKPTKENGWKFELFLHSFLPMVDQGKLGVLMVDRSTEFAPVKNADANSNDEPLPDTPAFARRMLLAESTKWLSAIEADGNGLSIEPSAKGKIEVSYLVSYAGEDLHWLKRLHKKTPLGGAGGYLDHEGEYQEVDPQ